MPTNFVRALGVLLALASGALWSSPASTATADGTYWLNLPEDLPPAAVMNAIITGVVTLEQTITLTLERNPALKSLEAQVQAAQAEARHSGLLSNPEMDVTIENFGNSNAIRVDSAEMTVAFSQSFGLGNKRGKRRNQGVLAADVAACEYMQKKAELIAELRKAFLAVLADQQRRVVADQQLQLAQEVLAAVNARGADGQSPLEQTRARTALATSRIAVNSTQRDLDASRIQLALFWGNQMPLFAKVSGKIETISESAPDLQTLVEGVAKHPEVAKCTAEVAHQEATVELSLAERMPDITVSGGVRHFQETNDNALVAGLSVPLPLFNRNQEAVSEARHRLTAAKADLETTRSTIVANLKQAHQALLCAKAEARMLADEVLPGARQAFVAARKGYRQGQFGYLELLDTSRELSELTRAHIDALSAYQTAVIEVARWSGLNPAPVSRG
jgi:cobalt-zinc-cadmium efflux system outer membrane protein